MANFYDIDEVKRFVPIRQYLKDQGVRTVGNRCAAMWRGGDDLSCAIYDTHGENNVYDYKDARRLNVIDLCRLLEGKSYVEAKIALGERYGVPAADGSTRPPKRPKSKAVPNWVRVSWLFLNAEEEKHISDAYKHINEGGDYLTDADLEWSRRVAGFVSRGMTLDNALRVAIEMQHQLEAREAA